MSQDRFIKLDSSGPSPEVRQLVIPVDISKRKALSSFYASLHSLLGPPTLRRHEGYCYLVQDRETGALFYAELNQFGQGYYGDPRAKGAMETFEAMRQATQPVPCSFEYEHDFGRTVLGWQDGELFEKHIEE